MTTDRTTVGLLDDVTLTCVVNRAVPMPDNYTWIHVDTNTTLVEETISSTYTFAPFKDEIGTYRCEVITEAGYGMDTIAIELEGKLVTNDCMIMLNLQITMNRNFNLIYHLPP